MGKEWGPKQTAAAGEEVPARNNEREGEKPHCQILRHADRRRSRPPAVLATANEDEREWGICPLPSSLLPRRPLVRKEKGLLFLPLLAQKYT